MAEFDTMRRTSAGVRATAVDDGLRAHMNKVYGTMSVGMVITALAAWAVAGPRASSAVPTEYMFAEGKYLTPLRRRDLHLAAEVGDHVRAAGVRLRHLSR